MIVLSSALAAPSDREPLPALAVERPLAMPRGWTEATLGLRGADGASLGAGLRYGVIGGLELYVGSEIARGEPLALGTRFGALVQPVRREPPNQALGLAIAWSTPYGDRPAAPLEIAALAQRQFGPLLARISAGPHLGRSPLAACALSLLLQLGPAALLANAQAEIAAEQRAAVLGYGALLQFSRGLALRGAISHNQRGSERDRSAEIALEVAF